MYKKEAKPSQNKRIYLEDIAVINRHLSEDHPRVADYVHFLLVEYGDFGEIKQEVHSEGDGPIPEKTEEGKRTSIPKDEVAAPPTKRSSVTLEEAYKINTSPMDTILDLYRLEDGGWIKVIEEEDKVEFTVLFADLCEKPEYYEEIVE